RPRGARGGEGRGEIERDHAIPRGAVGLEEAAAGEAADQRDQDVEPAMARLECVDEIADGSLVGDVRPHEEQPVFRAGLDARLEPIALGIHDERPRDRGALGEQAAGHRLAQRASPPGHERDAAGEAHSAAGIAMMAERWMSSYRTLPTSKSAMLSRSFLNVCSKD